MEDWMPRLLPVFLIVTALAGCHNHNQKKGWDVIRTTNVDGVLAEEYRHTGEDKLVWVVRFDTRGTGMKIGNVASLPDSLSMMIGPSETEQHQFRAPQAAGDDTFELNGQKFKAASGRMITFKITAGGSVGEASQGALDSYLPAH
jgi:hypothetical protein